MHIITLWAMMLMALFFVVVTVFVVIVVGFVVNSGS